MSTIQPSSNQVYQQFYETYANAPEFLKQLVSEIPWGHKILNHAAD